MNMIVNLKLPKFDVTAKFSLETFFIVYFFPSFPLMFCFSSPHLTHTHDLNLFYKLFSNLFKQWPQRQSLSVIIKGLTITNQIFVLRLNIIDKNTQTICTHTHIHTHIHARTYAHIHTHRHAQTHKHNLFPTRRQTIRKMFTSSIFVIPTTQPTSYSAHIHTHTRARAHTHTHTIYP